MSIRQLAAVSVVAWSSIGFSYAAYEPCGSLQNAYGPFDYRSQRARIEIVERYHFTPAVESLQGGNTSSIGGDIDYTLRASPNHHRALMAMANLALRSKTKRVQGAHYSVDCYFDRAIRFAADDGTVHMIYGTYLFRAGEKANALKELERADSLDQNDANLHYNLGLVYLSAKDYDKALSHAQRAYALGFPLAGLKNKLIALGKWKEPVVTTSPSAAQQSGPK